MTDITFQFLALTAPQGKQSESAIIRRFEAFARVREHDTGFRVKARDRVDRDHVFTFEHRYPYDTKFIDAYGDQWITSKNGSWRVSGNSWQETYSHRQHDMPLQFVWSSTPSMMVSGPSYEVVNSASQTTLIVTYEDGQPHINVYRFFFDARTFRFLRYLFKRPQGDFDRGYRVMSDLEIISTEWNPKLNSADFNPPRKPHLSQ